jgi:hypothetical protein
MTQIFPALTDGSNGEAAVVEESSRTVYQLLLQAFGALAFAATWGLAAGAAAPLQALVNVYKVPMVLALSMAASLPAVFVTRHLLLSAVSPLALIGTLVRSLFRASLVLLAFAPLLLVYAYTSERVAPAMAQGSALLALVCGGAALCWEFARLRGPRLHLFVLGLVSLVAFSLALLQLVSIATPILTLPTVFGAGIDGVLR